MINYNIIFDKPKEQTFNVLCGNNLTEINLKIIAIPFRHTVSPSNQLVLREFDLDTVIYKSIRSINTIINMSTSAALHSNKHIKVSNVIALSDSAKVLYSVSVGMLNNLLSLNSSLNNVNITRYRLLSDMDYIQGTETLVSDFDNTSLDELDYVIL